MALVAAAGPASNLAIAWAMAIPIRAGLTPYHTPYNPNVFQWGASDYFGLFFTAGVLLNCTLAVFNFLPLAPLDGFRVWTGLLPIELAKPLYRLEPYGMLILMALFFLGPVNRFQLLRYGRAATNTDNGPRHDRGPVMTSRALHRSRQFFASLRPRVDAALRNEAFGVLSDAEQTLFESMTSRDQQHCLDVYGRLRKEHSNSDLLVAALLHDCGQGQIALWHRVAYVLLDASAPSLLRRVAVGDDGPAWRQALYRCVHHEELGAELAQQAGSSPRVVALILANHTDAPNEHLAALQAADDAA